MLGAAAPAGDERRLLREIADIRLQRERLVLAEAERAAAIARSELVNAAAAAGAWRQAIEELMVSLEQFVVALPAALGLGGNAAEVAQLEWDAFLRRHAQQASNPATD